MVEMPGGSLRFLGMSARTLECQPRLFPHFEWHSQPEPGVWEVSAETWEVTSGKEKLQGEPPRACRAPSPLCNEFQEGVASGT